MKSLYVLLACLTFAIDVGHVRGSAAQETTNVLEVSASASPTIVVPTMLTAKEPSEEATANKSAIHTAITLEGEVSTTEPLDHKSQSTTQTITPKVTMAVDTTMGKVTTKIPATSTTTLASIQPTAENETSPDQPRCGGNRCSYDSYEDINLERNTSLRRPYAVVIKAVFRIEMVFTGDLHNYSSPEFTRLSTSLSNHIKETLVNLNLTANSTNVAILSFRNGSVLADTLIRERTAKLGRTVAALRGDLSNISDWPQLKFNNQSLAVSLNSTPVFNLCEINSVCNVSTSWCSFNSVTEQRTCICRPYHEPIGSSPFRCQLKQYTSTGKVFGIVLVVLLATGFLLSILIILYRQPRRTRPSDMMSFASLSNQDSLGEPWHGGQTNQIALAERTTMISTTEVSSENPPQSDKPRMSSCPARRPTPAAQVQLYQAANSRRPRPGRPAMITSRSEEPYGKRLHSSTPPTVYDIFSKMNDNELARIRQTGYR